MNYKLLLVAASVLAAVTVASDGGAYGGADAGGMSAPGDYYGAAGDFMGGAYGGAVTHGCRMHAGMRSSDDVRTFVLNKLQKITSMKLKNEACEAPLKRLLKQVRNGSLAMDSALLFNATALTDACTSKCPLDELIYTAEQAFVEVREELCEEFDGPGTGDYGHHEDEYEHDAGDYGRPGDYGGHDGEDDGPPACVLTCFDDDKEMPSTDTAWCKWVQGVSRETECLKGCDDKVWEQREELLKECRRRHDGHDSGSDSSSSSGLLPLNFEDFHCATDCLDSLSLTTIAASGGINGCELLAGAESTSCFSDCNGDVKRIVRELQNVCTAHPDTFSVSIEEAMCAASCDVSLSWESNPCSFINSEGAECAAKCSDKIYALRQEGQKMCRGGRRLMDAWTLGASGPAGVDACRLCHESCDELMMKMDDSHPKCQEECDRICNVIVHEEGDGGHDASGASGPATWGDDGHSDASGASGPATWGDDGHSDASGASGPAHHDDAFETPSAAPRDPETTMPPSVWSGDGHIDDSVTPTAAPRDPETTMPPTSMGASGPAGASGPGGYGGFNKLEAALFDIEDALARAWMMHDVMCLHEDEHHDDHYDHYEEEDATDYDDGMMCMSMLAALDAKALCTSGCANKLFSHFDALLAPMFDGADKPSAVMEEFLCARVKDTEADEPLYCSDLMADVAAATDADSFFTAVPALCTKDAAGERPCLKAADAIAGHFSALTGGRHADAAAALCESAAADSESVRTHVETPVVLAGDEDMTADDEKKFRDRLAGEIKDAVTSKFGLPAGSVTVIVKLERAVEARRVRRLASSNNHVLKVDVSTGSDSTVSAEEIFNTCVKPKVEAASEVASVGEMDRTNFNSAVVTTSAFSFEEGEDISTTPASGEDTPKKDGGFLFGYSKTTVLAAGGAAAGLLLAVAAALIVRARRRNAVRRAARRQSRQLGEEPAAGAAPAVVATKIDLYDKA